MNTKHLRNASYFLCLVSALASGPAFADDDADAAAMGATRIVSGTEDFVGPGGAAASGGALPVAVPAVREKAMTKYQCFSPMVWTGSACKVAIAEPRSEEEINQEKRGI